MTASGARGRCSSGSAIFALGALVSGLADSAGVVIVGRAVQGAGAALVMPATLSLITAIFPPEERQRAIAIWVGFAGAGGALGPIVSGALLEEFWWGSAFLVNIPIVAVTAFAIARFSPRSRDDSATPLDPRGAVLSLVGLAALLFGIIEGPERGWTSGLVVGTFVVAAVFLVGFVQWERRAAHPMLPLTFFADRRFSVGSGVITTSFFVMFGFFFLFSLYLQFARGYSPLDAGLATLPFAVTIILVSPRSAVLAARYGSGRTIAGGFALIGAGMLAMSLVAVDTPYPAIVVAMVLLASGIGVVMAPATGGIMSAVPLAKAGVGSAVNDTTRELGGALGIAVFGSIVNSAYRSNIDLGGLDLSSSVAAEAEESVGAAAMAAGGLGREGGGDRRAGGDGVHRRLQRHRDGVDRDRRGVGGGGRRHLHPRQGGAGRGPGAGRAGTRWGVRRGRMTWCNRPSPPASPTRGSNALVGWSSTPPSPCSSSGATGR